MRTLCADLHEVVDLACPSPITVSSMLPRSIVVFAPISTSSPMMQRPDVRNLLVRAVAEHVAKSVTRDTRARMHDAARADLTRRVHGHMRIQARAVTDVSHRRQAPRSLRSAPRSPSLTPRPIRAVGAIQGSAGARSYSTGSIDLQRLVRPVDHDSTRRTAFRVCKIARDEHDSGVDSPPVAPTRSEPRPEK